jgi:hypothetical protein
MNNARTGSSLGIQNSNGSYQQYYEQKQVKNPIIMKQQNNYRATSTSNYNNFDQQQVIKNFHFDNNDDYLSTNNQHSNYEVFTISSSVC